MSPLRRPVRREGPLRVLFVVPDLRVGGAERHVVTLLPELDPERVAASVVCLGPEGDLFSDLGRAGIPARALHRTKRQFPLALAELVREMARTRPDVVVTRSFNAEVLGRVAAAITGVPRSVVWVHNCGTVEPRPALRRWADRLLDRVTAGYYGVAQGQVPYLTGELGLHPSKITVVRNGTDPLRFDPAAVRDPLLAAEWGIAAEAPVIGILAALRPEKDHETLLLATRLVLEQVPAARLLVVGDGPLREVLERQVRALGIAEQVAFTGNRADVARVLSVVDVLAISSYTVECFPFALLEAMAAGRPAVCTAIGGLPEMIVDGVTGRLVPPRDPDALAAALVPLVRDRELARRMGRAARARVEDHFTLEHSVRAAQSALEATAGRAPAVVL